MTKIAHRFNDVQIATLAAVVCDDSVAPERDKHEKESVGSNRARHSEQVGRTTAIFATITGCKSTTTVTETAKPLTNPCYRLTERKETNLLRKKKKKKRRKKKTDRLMETNE